MARVNHKLVKQRLNEKRSKITDRQFFTSRILAGHFEDMAIAQTRRYKYNRRVRVMLFWEPKNKDIAWTDNSVIYINCGHKIVTDVKGRENRYQIVCGLFTHELGHVLYTDFLAGQTHLNYFGSYLWYPAPPVFKSSVDMKNEAAMWEYVKADAVNLKIVQKVLHDISNILEDGYIENRMLNNFPGTLGFGLDIFRKLQFGLMPTVTQMKEAEADGEKHVFESILGNILSYAKFGEIKYGEEPLSDERIKIVFGLIHEIDDALLTHNAKTRLESVNAILVRCWNYIEEFCELCKQCNEEENSGGGSATVEETVSRILGSAAGSSKSGTGSTMPVSESESESESSATAGKRSKTKEDAEKSESENSGDGQSEDNSDDGSGEVSISKSGKQDVSEEEGGRIPLTQTDDLYEPEGGTTEYNADYEREQYENAASDIERMLGKMAEKAACEQLENERTKELNEVAKSISYGNIHKGISIRVNRIASVDEDLVDQYNCISGPLLIISRQLQKNLVKQLDDVRRGGKQTGLMYGRRLDAHAIHRNDGKVFCKNNLPNETPEISVGLLLDESGSMGCADRATYARATAIILYDFCQKLNIPIMVYGHSTVSGKSSLELFSYAEFDGYDSDDKYRLMDISARDNNRDGAALRYVAERLSKRTEPVKILIVVSDGQPVDYGYRGTAAEEDMRGIKQEYKRKGILFVAAAIGSDKQNIERIYGDSFLDITDLNQLPVKLTNVIKRFIRV